MRKYQYQIYYHTSRGRYFIKIRYSFLGLVFWLTLRDKYSSNIETFLDKDKAIERAEDYLRYLYLKRKNSRVLKVTGRIDITSRLKSVREDGEGLGMIMKRGFLNAKRIIGFGIRYGLPNWI